jgi:peptidoglycan hydrolase-like protein with peptidoglycan-binding domain
MRRRWAFGAVVVVAAGAVLAGVSLTSADGAEPEASTPAKTAKLDVRSISSVETFDGMLRYEGQRAVPVSAKGIVTKTRSIGEVVERGGALAWIDNKPVTLLYGDLPQWRSLQVDAEGPDVRQLEQALVDLGYANGLNLTVDEEFTGVTKTAVENMQEALGLEEDGVVDLGEIVFLPGPSRITEVTTEVGEQPGQSLVQVSGTSRVVEIDLDASDRSAVTSGQTVTVELPDGKDVEGKVRSVATAVDMGEQGESDTVKVVVDLPAGTDVPFDQAPVDVEVRTVLAQDVLAAPVTALLAEPGGEYAVEKVGSDGTVVRVPVELGAFSNGYVQISGDVKQGDVVAVAS